jgi:hypothetical protein
MVMERCDRPTDLALDSQSCRWEMQRHAFSDSEPIGRKRRLDFTCSEGIGREPDRRKRRRERQSKRREMRTTQPRAWNQRTATRERRPPQQHRQTHCAACCPTPRTLGSRPPKAPSLPRGRRLEPGLANAAPANRKQVFGNNINSGVKAARLRQHIVDAFRLFGARLFRSIRFLKKKSSVT